MGYDVSILKTASGRRQRFSEQDFIALTTKFPEWSYDSSSQTLLKQTGEEEGFWLDLSPLELTAKEPNKTQVQLMIEIAQALGGRVRGDDLETYRTPTETFNHPDDEKLRRFAGPLGPKEPSKYAKLIWHIQLAALILLALNFIAYVLHGVMKNA
jgi:hypothetical protein